MKEEMTITVQTTIVAPIETVWKCWTTPEDILKWNAASDTWHTILAENDLRVCRKFSFRMEAKDGSFGFDFEGTYNKILKHELIIYTLTDGRRVKVEFSTLNDKTSIVETFEPEGENPVELQRGGWQGILNNFKKYTEQQNKIDL